MTSQPLLLTKLHPPSISDELVQRPHLMQLLHNNFQKPLTLVSAPAGFGKSVLVSMWLQSSYLSYGWVSLDKTDNDLNVFLDYLLASMHQIAPELEFQTQHLLELPALPPVSVVVNYLLNDLAHIDKACILVLDDLHLIQEPSIFELLTRWLQYPPRNVHLVIISRWEPPLPLLSLRASGHLTEIRLRDLRFRRAETADYLAALLKHDISDDVAEYWTSQTEGWAAGIRLVGLSLMHTETNPDLHVVLRGKTGYLAEYLMTEVIGTLPRPELDYLLKTSVLTRFCAPLCDAVFGTEEDSLEAKVTGAYFISWLRTSNMFLIELDSTQDWFRFHHLFQEQLQKLLEQRLSNQEIIALKKRASRWFAENGWIDEAIQYAVMAQDIEYATNLFFNHRYQLMNREEWHQLERWLKWFPADIVDKSPVLVITHAHLAVEKGIDKAILPAREKANHLLNERKLASLDYQVVKGDIAHIDTLVFLLRGQPAEMMSSVEKALDLLPPEAEYSRAVMHGAHALFFQQNGDFEASTSVIRQALSEVVWSDAQRARLYLYLCMASMMEGDLASVLASSIEGFTLAHKHKLWHSRSQLQYFQGVAHYLRGEWTEAESVLVGLTDSPPLTQPSYLAYGACALARIYCYTDRPDLSGDMLQHVSDYLEETGNRFVLEIIRAFQVDLAIEAGEIETAYGLATSVNFDLRSSLWFHYLPQLTVVRLALAKGTSQSLNDASVRLQKMRADLRRVNRKLALIDVLALQALVYFVQGDKKNAYEQLVQSLTLAKPGRFIRNFVDLGGQMPELLSHFLRDKSPDATTSLTEYVKVLLTAYPQNKVTSQQPLESLTKREMEVLDWLATDYSPKEIANKMHVSVATVRSHTKHIYSKLGVNSRFEAVQRAKELNLLRITK